MDLIKRFFWTAIRRLAAILDLLLQAVLSAVFVVVIFIVLITIAIFGGFDDAGAPSVIRKISGAAQDGFE